jgi:UDP-2,3-diacylglucosamine pyrophosphatase LpxH
MKPIYIIGDNHGKYDVMFRFIEAYEIKDCILIHVGDGGEGFVPYDKQMRQFNHYNDQFKSKEIEYLSIRGNHSDPAYFDGSVNLSHFKLLPDYHTQIINGEKFLFVGGAISIDRKIRKEGFSYWENEPFVLDKSKIEECDVLITHSAPTWLGPFDKKGILSWCEKDEFLWRDCLKEREDHDILFELAKPKKSYAGHFHQRFSVDINGCRAKILAELEIIPHN